MDDMARSPERDPQLASILASHKKALAIGIEISRRLRPKFAVTRGASSPIFRTKDLGLHAFLSCSRTAHKPGL